MKKFLLLIISFISLNSLFSQTYKPLLVDGNKWHITNQYVGNGGDPRNIVDEGYYYIEKDTIIHNNTYKKINFHFSLHCDYPDIQTYCPVNYNRFAAYLREDINNKKVYRYFKSDDTEHLLYDFSANAGDNVILNYNSNYGGIISSDAETITNNYVINDKGTGKIFGKNIIYISYGLAHAYEGIGSDGGLLQAPFCGILVVKNSSPQEHLIFDAFEDNSGIYYRSYEGECGLLMATKENKDPKDIILYYSKENQDLKIIDTKTQNYSIKFFDASGKILQEIKTKSNENFKLDKNYYNTVLFYIITNNSGSWKGKIIF